MWSIFKKYEPAPLVSQEIEQEYLDALKKKKEADFHFHNVKSTVAPKTIEIFLKALADGKIEKEPHHG